MKRISIILVLLTLMLAVAPVSAAVTRTWNQSDPSPALSGCMDENYASITCPDFNATEPWASMGRVVIDGQTMVQVKKFYYRTDNVTIGGFHYMNFSVSAVPLSGYSVHPWYTVNETIVPVQYISAYEGAATNSTTGYNTGGVNSGDFEGVNFTVGTGDKLSSVAGVKPMGGANNTAATLPNFRILAHNTGPNFELQSFNGVSAVQLLYIVEKGNWDSQTVIGPGVTNLASGTGNQAVNTGSTAALGNATGNSSVLHSSGVWTYPISYRGIENFYGNIWKWVDGLNIKADRNPWIADHDFKSDKFSHPYMDTGLTLPSSNGYISNLTYGAGLDWAFLPSAAAGDNTHYLCDYYYQATDTRAARLGGGWGDGASAGAFYWAVHRAASYVYRDVGGRLAYTPPIIANFSYTNTSAAFTFTDASYTISTLTGLNGTPSSWQWDFGDGTTSTEQNPTHTFPAAGTYAVNLTTSDGTNYGTMIQTAYVFPLAQFAPAGPITVWQPNSVAFTDTSTNTPTSWNWDFGDGDSSILQNPTHVYTTPGMHHVIFTATNSGGSSTNSTWVESSINDFTASNFTGFAPLPATFTNTTQGNVTTFRWDFGDGANSTAISPTHIFGVGEHSVNYTVTNNSASNSTYRNITVEDLDFYSTSGTDFVTAPVLVSFNDNSTVATSWLWSFGDGGTSTDKNPWHLYTQKGSFNVTLVATAGLSSDVEIKQGYINIDYSSQSEKNRSEFDPDLSSFFAALAVACIIPILIGLYLIKTTLTTKTTPKFIDYIMENSIMLFLLVLVLVILLLFIPTIGAPIEAIK